MDTQKEPHPIPAETPAEPKPEEIGGAKREREATRYGDWEINGKCVDF